MIETTSTNATETLVHGDRGRASERTSARSHDEEFPLELRETTLADVCRTAIADVAARFQHRTIEYAPDPDPGRAGAGQWDARRVTYAVTILLEDALKRTREADVVSVRWREHAGLVALRVQYPCPLERGDRFVTCFEDGVRPDGAEDKVGTLRLVAALEIARQHRGQLARIRTRAGTAYVLELPRRRRGSA